MSNNRTIINMTPPKRTTCTTNNVCRRAAFSTTEQEGEACIEQGIQGGVGGGLQNLSLASFESGCLFDSSRCSLSAADSYLAAHVAAVCAQ